MCKKLLLSMFKQLGNEAWARLKPHRDRCGLDWCVGVVSEEGGMCRERDRRDVLGARLEGCAGSGGAQKYGSGSPRRGDDGGRSAARVGGIGHDNEHCEAEG
jgi:hypothetical protein